MLTANAAQQALLTELATTSQVDRNQLDGVRERARQLGLPLSDSLVSEKLLSHEQLARLWAKIHKLPFLDLAAEDIDESLILQFNENLLRRKSFLPVRKIEESILVALADPADPTGPQTVKQRLQGPVNLAVASQSQILEIISTAFGRARSIATAPAQRPAAAQATSKEDLADVATSTLVDGILDEALERRASDIHVEPEDDRIRIRYRIDGALVESRALPKEMLPQIVSRIKVLGTMDIAERRAPQDGSFRYETDQGTLDCRVAVIPTIRGEKATKRLLSTDRNRVSLEGIGMPDGVRVKFESIITKPHGIILITGPTGSGKTTTLYAALQEINTEDKHIVTVENPVEYNFPGVNQIQVDEAHGVSFANALRSIVRHDPDIIMVGEIRDFETASLALEASLTGHLVFATLHTNNAAGAITRLIDMGCEPFLVASGVIGSLAQRLVRCICPRCRRVRMLTERELHLCGKDATESVEIYEGIGCGYCFQTGYFDRIGIFELLELDSVIRDLVLRKASTEQIEQAALESGAQMLRDDGIRKVFDGETTLDEVLRVTANSG